MPDSTLDILTFGEALVEVMRTEIDQPLNAAALFAGPYPSGAPFIFAVQAARLGAKVGAVGAVGRDPFGECIIRQLESDRVDTRGLHILNDYTTGVAFVGYQRDGGREFVFHAAHAAAGQLAPSMLKPELFNGLKCLHIMGSALSLNEGALETGTRALQMARESGAKISFDPNLRPQMMSVHHARSVFAPFIEATDILIPTADELIALTGASDLDSALNAIRQVNPQALIVLTQGADGCTVYEQDGVPQPVPGFTVQEVDPTGAGDCFDAGYLVRWLQGDSPVAAARFANACGALAVTVQGPMAGAKHADEVVRFMAKQDAQ